MNWASPRFLWALLALLPLFFLLRALLRRRRAALSRAVDLAAHPFLAPGLLPRTPARRLFLRILALACILLAAARPQFGFHWRQISRKGLDIVVVLDTSRSMSAPDIKPSRLQQAKWGLRDLLRSLHGDRVALVPFAGASVLQCPLTVDYAAFAMTLDDLYCGIIPRGGTAIEQALRTALDALPEPAAADQCILLVTDGEDHVGDPLSLLPELKRRGIRVYSIGIGTLEGDLLPGDSGAFFKNRNGEAVRSALREDVLQRLALETGGSYVRSTAGDTGLERLFAESISALERSEQESRSAKVFEERFAIPLALALLFLLWEALLPRLSHPPKEPAP